MYENNAAEECFEWIRLGMWTWFVTLKYPREGSPKHKGPRASSADDAFAWWSNELLQNTKEWCVAYVRATENREDGDVLFHVLLRGVPSEQEESWRWRWFDISAGAAWGRTLNAGIERLFKYLFHKVHCDIECYAVGDIKVYRADENTRRE